MEQIYLITAHGGEYGDAWSQNLYAVKTQAQAEQAVAEERATLPLMLQVLHAHSHALTQYLRATQHLRVVVPPAPIWPSDGDDEARTQYYRDHRQWVDLIHQAEVLDRPLVLSAEQKAAQTAYDHAVSLGLKDRHLQQLGFSWNQGVLKFEPTGLWSDTQYSYEVLEVL